MPAPWLDFLGDPDITVILCGDYDLLISPLCCVVMEDLFNQLYYLADFTAAASSPYVVTVQWRSIKTDHLLNTFVSNADFILTNINKN